MQLQVAWSIWLFSYCLFTFSRCKSETITVLSIVGGSHSREAEMISEALSKNGHQVTLVRSSERTAKIDPLVKIMSYAGEKVPESFIHAMVTKMMGDFSLNDLDELNRFHTRICEAVLQDDSIMSQIKRSDLIMADVLMQCHLFFGEQYGIPVISFRYSVMYLTTYLGIPSHLSYNHALGSGLPQEIDFPQRLSTSSAPY